MMSMRIEIDGSSIRSVDEFHEFLSRALNFGSHYGANLSALWDRLSTDVERPVEIVWKNSESSKNSLGPVEFEKIRTLLQRVQMQDESFGWADRFSIVFE